MCVYLSIYLTVAIQEIWTQSTQELQSLYMCAYIYIPMYTHICIHIWESISEYFFQEDLLNNNIVKYCMLLFLCHIYVIIHQGENYYEVLEIKESFINSCA